ncbi:MAG: TetR/AcrR family transcriptional regulator [Candidatus Acidiferrales bacterium]|jgi:AcrR family transcriptional regulator
MQTAATLKTAPLQPDNWIRAALARLANEGIESVRIELLARDLGVSKGSFYWHFRDREDLLTCVLDRWEADETEWLAATDVKMRAAARWARFVEHCADLNHARLEGAVRSWAQRDEGMSTRISTRISGIDKKRTAHIASVLRDIGFTAPSAASWSDLALLVYLGWLDRVTRDTEFQSNGRSLGEFLSDLILAASQHSSPATT